MEKLLCNSNSGWILLNLLMGQSIVVILLFISLPLFFTVQNSLLDLELRVSRINQAKNYLHHVLFKVAVSHPSLSVQSYDLTLNKARFQIGRHTYYDVLYEK